MHTINVFLLFFSFISFSVVKTWKSIDLKNPLYYPGFCKVSLKNTNRAYICDPIEYLPMEKKNSISRYISEIKLKSPFKCSNETRGERGFVLGVAIVSQLTHYTSFSSIRSCGESENNIKCFLRGLLRQWHMSECGNDAVIVVEGGRRPVTAYIEYGETAAYSMSSTCLRRIERDLGQFVVASEDIELIVGKIHLYTTDSEFCLKRIEDTMFQIKTELLIGLIVGSTCIIILLVLLIPFWRKRLSSNRQTERRNSNIVRPMGLCEQQREYCELPPKYSEVIFNTEKVQQHDSDIVVIDSLYDGIDPPTYHAVIASPKYIFREDFQLK